MEELEESPLEITSRDTAIGQFQLQDIQWEEALPTQDQDQSLPPDTAKAGARRDRR